MKAGLCKKLVSPRHMYMHHTHSWTKCDVSHPDGVQGGGCGLF